MFSGGWKDFLLALLLMAIVIGALVVLIVTFLLHGSTRIQ